MRFQKLFDDAIIPTRSTIDAAGYDFHANEEVLILPGEVKLVKTGVTIQFDFPNQYLQVCSRSGLALKQSVAVFNAPGIVDADYYPNEIGVILINQNTKPIRFKVGDRIAQGIISEYLKTSDDEETSVQRDSGFGSTGI